VSIKRRDFITLLGGAAAWPLAARAQRPAVPVRRVGALIGWSESDPELRSYFAVFVEELARLGWADGGNVRIEHRWTNAQFDRITPLAKEIIELRPDAILSVTTPVTAALQRETSAIPIVFAVVSDPVGAGIIATLARPGGNITGFINTEESMGGKWLSLLKEIAPSIKRVAIMFNPDTAPGGGNYYLASFERAAQALAVEPISARVHSDAEIEAEIASLGRERAGLVIMTDSYTGVHRGTIISSAARHSVPTIMEAQDGARSGGLMSYGSDLRDLFRGAAGYTDRVLRGMKPQDLPVQLPTRLNLTINLKTARALGLTVPPTLLAIADEVIE
jgi:putative ABC transport system substrate-binding protein